MEEKIEITKKIIKYLIIVELFSLILVFLFNFSIRNILLLTLINFLLFTFMGLILKIHISHSLLKNKIYNELRFINLINSFVIGLFFLIISSFSSFKSYGLSITLIILFSILPLIFKLKIINSKLKFKELSTHKKREIFIHRSIFTMIYGVIIPNLLDVHFNLLFMPKKIYFFILVVYISVIASIIIKITLKYTE